MKNLIYIFIGIIIGVVVCTANKKGCKDEKQVIEVVDTLVVYETIYNTDTIRKEQIVSIPKYVNKEIVINDTTYIEKKHQDYKDSTDSYDITINCTDFNYYQLNIHKTDTVRFTDTIRFEIPTIKEKKNKLRFSHGVQAGVGYGFFNRKPDLYVGYGIQIGF